jgi:hypothetical protein
MAIEQQHTNGTLSDAKQRVSAMFPGAVEMPDQSGAPSADYCIMRPATKEDWPKNKWVQVGPYVSGNPWEAALERISKPTAQRPASYTAEQIEEAMKLHGFGEGARWTLLNALQPAPKTLMDKIATLLYDTLGHAAGKYDVLGLVEKIAQLREGASNG